ncbi:MAG: hypothetical protein PHN44_10900 [Candidatus Marinimicrobia bacterium]|nr:hypothetical protein [Candidatus Neomarinimicrobiota bacterium]
MDPLTLSLLIARIILINTKNLLQAVEQAKKNDSKVTSEELPEIIFDTAIKSLDDLGAGDLRGLLGQVKM